MLTQDKWTKHDKSLNLVCNAALLGHAIPSAVLDFQRVRRKIVRSTKSFDDFAALRDSELIPRDVSQRKAAWIMQHIDPAGRSILVAPQLIGRRGKKLFSPLISQLNDSGLAEESAIGQVVLQSIHQSTRDSHDRIEVVHWNPDSRQITLVKAQPYSRVTKSRSGGSVSVAGSLFSKASREIGNIEISAAVVNSLLHARRLVSKAFPSVSVRLYYALIDDDYSYNFQIFDLTSATFMPSGSTVNSSKFAPPAFTVADFMQRGRPAADYLPSFGWAAGKILSLKDALHRVPVDRYTRSAMFLYILYQEQMRSPNDLVKLSVPEWADLVEGEFGISLTPDIRRHDLEDCVRAGGFARRLPYRVNSYALTSTGLGRMNTLINKYNRMAPTSSDNLIQMAIGQDWLWVHDTGAAA